ncbi:MAG: TfoX/Sxy family protein [Bacteroidota bacterium]
MNPKTDHFLLDRIRNYLASLGVEWSEKRMFGGNCFMVNEKMLLGTYKGGIMTRVDPEELPSFLNRPGAEQMIHGGRIMTGYAFLEGEAYDSEIDLQFWIDQCLAFNPRAKSSKKRKKSS